MRMCIYIVILILISCQEYKKQENDDRYIVFNLYIYNPQNEMYQKLKRNVHFLSGG